MVIFELKETVGSYYRCKITKAYSNLAVENKGKFERFLRKNWQVIRYVVGRERSHMWHHVPIFRIRSGKLP